MSSTLFTGASRYSNDFGAVIDRSVGIASLRLTQMQQERVRSSDQLGALRSIEDRVAGLQSMLAALGDSVGSKAIQASSSDGASLRVSAGDAVSVGSYTMRVVSLGSFSNAVGKTASRPVVSDPTAGSFVTGGVTKLTLRITDHNTGAPSSTDTVIDLSSGTSLQKIVDAINAQAGSKVQAAVVNLGSTEAPNYTISLQSTKLGKLALQLKEGDPPVGGAAGDLMDVDETSASDPTLGAKAEYKINGVAIMTESRTVTIAPNLTAELLKADSSKDISVTVARGTSAFSAAMSSFVNAYNALASELDAASKGNSALRGNSLVAGIRTQLRTAITGEFSGTFKNLAKIGVEFTSTGLLKFNGPLFDAETKDKQSELAELIGSSTTGGFMKTITDSVNSIANATGGGFLTDAIETLDVSLKAEDSRIAAETSRVEQFTKDLQERLAKADAVIAQMEQQANYFNSMFEAMRANQKSYS